MLLCAVAAGLATTLQARAERVDVGMGVIDLPAGAHLQPGQGLDSAIGTLVSRDGTPPVGFDIGGQFDAPVLARKELTFFRHGTIDGVPWVAYRLKTMKKYALSVWFPRPVPAIFGANCASGVQRLWALRLILRFHPNREALGKQTSDFKCPALSTTAWASCHKIAQRHRRLARGFEVHRLG